jgi:DNA-binding CsgD family transcriptional regulator
MASDISNMRSEFTRVNNARGQVWNLSEVNDQLLMGHNDGAFVIENNNALKLDGSSGFWLFQPLSPVKPSKFMIAGTYNGINIYDYQNGRFYDSIRHVHFESSRFVAMDNNIAWVGHPYLGLFRVDFKSFPTPKWSLYVDKQKILSKNRNYVYKIKNRIILSNDNGLFEYDAHKDDFVPSEFFRGIFHNEAVQYLKEDNYGNIWFIKNKHLGVVDFTNKQPQIIYIPEMDSRLLTSGYDFIYPYDLRNIFVAGEHGFYLLNYEKYKTMTDKISLLITSVKAIGETDSSLFAGHAQAAGIGNGSVNRHVPQLGYAWNTLLFAFSSPLYGRQASTEYSCMLENFDKAWSPWSKKTEKEYSYLPPGDYVFKVRARSHASDSPVVQSYRFSIMPPWYNTGWAWLLYSSILGLLIVAGYYRQKIKFQRQQRRHEEENKRLQYLHQLEIKKSEAEIVKLKNEKLEAELQLKNKELATTSINLVQRGEVLHKIKDEVLRMKKTGTEHEHNEEDFKKLIRMLEPEKVKHDWEQFALHFNHVHDEFLVALKREYPTLTPNEIKLCAYLRLNISSKEIAHIMNINVKSVELGRYRLRKKLQLDPGVHLFNFLLEFHSKNKKEDTTN